MGNSLQKSQKPQDEQQTEEDENSPFTCEICIEPMFRKFKNKDRCTHPFCIDCMIKYIEVKISENVSKIECPSLNCDHFLDPLSCRPMITPQLFDKWCDVLCDSTVLELERCYCPNRRCSALVVNECGGNVKKSKCPNCKRLFCYQCKVPWHAGFRCEESGEMRDRNDLAFGLLAEARKWGRCPQCYHFVELIEGCKIVKCRCGTSFCYKCGRKARNHWCGCEGPSMYCNWVMTFLVVLFLELPVYYLIMKAGRNGKH